jgi:mycothiol synthase
VSDPAVRVATQEDTEAITDLLNAHGTALHGEAEASPAIVSEWLANPDLEVRVGELDGRCACYGDVMLSVDGICANFDVRAHPELPATASSMLDELERIAIERGATKAWAFHSSEEHAWATVLRARGYVPIRHSFRMLITLDQPIEPARWPEGIAVREVRAGEERAVHAANDDAFADHWEFEPKPYERWARWTFESERFDPSLNFLALDGEEIAGICLCSMHWSGDPSYGWVGILGVRPTRRRRGIGLALLLHSFAEFRARGCRQVGLGVDAQSTTGALELYERAGMHVHRRQDTLERSL